MPRQTQNKKKYILAVERQASSGEKYLSYNHIDLLLLNAFVLYLAMSSRTVFLIKIEEYSCKVHRNVYTFH